MSYPSLFLVIYESDGFLDIHIINSTMSNETVVQIWATSKPKPASL